MNSVDTSQADKLLNNLKLSTNDMLDIEKPVALTIVNKQREKVPVDTGLTRTSIGPHIQDKSEKQIVDHVGPETDYAPYIELGVISKPNYPIQPFVRPSVFGNEKTINKVAQSAFEAKVKEKSGRA